MKIDQCLFGYDDGHRLLASSLSLGEETSLLTELSDLAPGTVFGKSEGYWTGLPVASLGCYVLMRTWAAPEMPRPGCVWTHALLIKPTLLESLSDLSFLQSLVTKPKTLFDWKTYREPLDVQLPDDYPLGKVVNDVIVRNLLLSLYETGNTTVEIASPGELDIPLFAVWSQQWPRLRRNFRFQTAASRSVRTNGSIRFDIMALLAPSEDKLSNKAVADPHWLSSATHDIQEGNKSSLRSFLWSYGRDVRRQRGSFRPLVEIYDLDLDRNKNNSQKLINIVSNAFPTLNDAGYLKENIVDGILIPNAQIDIVKFILLNSHDGIKVFPSPTSAGFDKLSSFWPQRTEDIFQVLEISADTENGFREVIFEKLANVIQPPQFWSSSSSYPYARKLLVEIRPDLLLNASEYLDDDSLIELVPVIPKNTSGIKEFLSKLLVRENSAVVKTVFEYFPNEIVLSLVYKANDSREIIANVWIQDLIRHQDLLLQTNVMSIITRTSLLYEFADALGWISPKVIDAGATPWYSALINSKNDLHGDKLDTFGVFLLVLACKTGGEDGLCIVELFYEFIHKKILNSKLSFKANEILSPYLPDIGWFWNWDQGQRFRMVIARSFIRNKWSPRNFSSLAKDKEGRTLLADTVSDMPNGEEYFKAISG